MRQGQQDSVTKKFEYIQGRGEGGGGE